MRDLQRAVERIADAVRAQETIFVHGDYDVDGMSSTALLVRVLRGLGAEQVIPFVPNRLTDGYDLGTAGVDAAQRAGATLVVTCDCGTSAREAVAALNTAGIDVIITDHHLPGHALPASYAICNPRHPECPSADKDLAAVGVAYKLALALCAAFNVSPALAHRQLDLVALATIADVAPLRGENRVMVRYGLKLLAETTHPGLRALIRSSGLEGKPLTAGRVGFVLAPRLNAAGRIADAEPSLARQGCHLILTTGGTGIAARDVTPEAIRSVARLEIPGFGESMRMQSLALTPNAILSRSLGAVVENSLVIALPGKPQGAVDCLHFIAGAIPHTVKILQRAPTSC